MNTLILMHAPLKPDTTVEQLEISISLRRRQQIALIPTKINAVILMPWQTSEHVHDVEDGGGIAEGRVIHEGQSMCGSPAGRWISEGMTFG